MLPGSEGGRGFMASTETGVWLEELAQRLCDVVVRSRLSAPRARRRSGDLKEIEFLTLSVLRHRDTLIVGDIQRLLGVLPAQMSRVIRALENRERPLIACRINPNDKRKIDVAITPAGAKAHHDYQTARIHQVGRLLGRLGEDDLEDLNRLVEKFRDLLGPAPA